MRQSQMSNKTATVFMMMMMNVMYFFKLFLPKNEMKAKLTVAVVASISLATSA